MLVVREACCVDRADRLSLNFQQAMHGANNSSVASNCARPSSCC